MSKFKLKNASKLKNSMEENLKSEKFEKMMKAQQSFIEDNMKHGITSVIWIFSDKEQYNNTLEKSWFVEFNNRAKILFEKKGYVVNGVIIKW